MRGKVILIGFLTLMTACESPAPGLEPLLLEKDFCPYLRFFDTYCNGSTEWRSDEQWKAVIENLLSEQSVQAKEINVYYRQPQKGSSDCPCGAITGHYAEVLVEEQDQEKVTAIGFKKCGEAK